MVHPTQYGFIVGGDVLPNILNVQMTMDYGKESKQQTVMIQLDIEKAYDDVNLSFIVQLMSLMGFRCNDFSSDFYVGVRCSTTCYGKWLGSLRQYH